LLFSLSSYSSLNHFLCLFCHALVSGPVFLNRNLENLFLRRFISCYHPIYLLTHHHMFPRYFLLSTNFIACLQNSFLGIPLILCINIDQLSSFTYIYSRFTQRKLCICYFFTRILRQHMKISHFSLFS